MFIPPYQNSSYSPYFRGGTSWTAAQAELERALNYRSPSTSRSGSPVSEPPLVFLPEPDRVTIPSQQQAHLKSIRANYDAGNATPQELQAAENQFERSKRITRAPLQIPDSIRQTDLYTPSEEILQLTKNFFTAHKNCFEKATKSNRAAYKNTSRQLKEAMIKSGKASESMTHIADPDTRLVVPLYQSRESSPAASKTRKRSKSPVK